MNLSKLIYDVREKVNQFVDDSNIDDRYIEYLYQIKRSKYLRQDLNNLQRSIDVVITQTLCLEVEEVEATECPTDLSCEKILRTVKPIPKPLELHLNVALTSVKPVTKLGVPFSFVTKERAVHFQHSPFKNKIFAFLDNDYHIYFVSTSESLSLLECISITGIFDDPLELREYKNCCSCDDSPVCFDRETTDYPITSHHIDLISEEIVQQLIRKLQIPEDKINNSDDL
jgi:hypothetical protein